MCIRVRGVVVMVVVVVPLWRCGDERGREDEMKRGGRGMVAEKKRETGGGRARGWR